MTITVEQFIEKHMVDGEVFTGVDVIEAYRGPQEVEYKTVSQTSVYQTGEQFFEVTNSWSNSGYWSDGESYDPHVVEVKPVKKMVEITEWECV